MSTVWGARTFLTTTAHNRLGQPEQAIGVALFNGQAGGAPCLHAAVGEGQVGLYRVVKGEAYSNSTGSVFVSGMSLFMLGPSPLRSPTVAWLRRRAPEVGGHCPFCHLVQCTTKGGLLARIQLRSAFRFERW